MKRYIIYIIGMSCVNKVEGIKTSTIVKIATPVVLSSIYIYIYIGNLQKHI